MLTPITFYHLFVCLGHKNWVVCGPGALERVSDVALEAKIRREGYVEGARVNHIVHPWSGILKSMKVELDGIFFSVHWFDPKQNQGNGDPKGRFLKTRRYPASHIRLWHHTEVAEATEEKKKKKPEQEEQFNTSAMCRFIGGQGGVERKLVIDHMSGHVLRTTTLDTLLKLCFASHLKDRFLQEVYHTTLQYLLSFVCVFCSCVCV